MRTRTLPLAAAVALATGSLGAQGRRPAAPLLRPIDSVRVAESDTFLLSRPSRLVAAPRGRWFVTDVRESIVAEIGPTGRLVRRYGRKGAGPGEVRAPTALALGGDSLLSVLDAGQQRVVSWDVRTGASRGSFPLHGWAPQLRWSRGVLRVGVMRVDSGTTVTTFAADGRRLSAEGVVPPMITRSPMLASPFGTVPFTEDGEWVYASYEVASSLYRWKRGASRGEERSIPVIRRRGVRAALFDEMLRDPAKAATIAWDRSAPYALERMGPGLLALVTLDATMTPKGMTGTFHLSVLDVARGRACVDGIVPVEADPMPVVTVVGDTLVVLRQGEDANGEAATWIRRYAIETSGCAWMPLGKAEARP